MAGIGINSPSRFLDDFDIIDVLGAGSFGVVYKVLKKQLRSYYAIKLTKCPYSKEEKLLREVKGLDQLNDHPGILHYHDAWFENIPKEMAQRAEIQKLIDTTKTSTQITLVPICISDQSSPYESQDDIECMDVQDTTESSTCDESLRFLFIQTELCKKDLGKWLRDKRNVNIRTPLYKKEVAILFYQIMCGVAHIHSKKFIHRDLKPGNILIDLNGWIKIGDFGLLTCVMPSGGDEADSGVDSRAEYIMGTELYMSPQQLNYLKPAQTDDIFTLGLIFYEMLENFPNHDQRATAFQGARKGVFPSTYDKNYKWQLTILKNLLGEKPQARKSAHKITELFPNRIVQEVVRSLFLRAGEHDK